VGADAELKRLFSAASSEYSALRNALASDGTDWKFNPLAAPHFGGEWEACVKSAKFHIKRVVGDALLSYVEFSTVLAQIEGLLNSRPLCPLSDDPDDLSSLTLGHFLTGGPINSFPEPSLVHLRECRLSRWQKTRQMIEHFWRRWSREYLQRMLDIAKWNREASNISVGTLVLMSDERFPPFKWPLARVSAVHQGTDGLVRVVSVKTVDGTFKRPVVMCVAYPRSN